MIKKLTADYHFPVSLKLIAGMCFCFLFSANAFCHKKSIEILLTPTEKGLMTKTIQAAIDSCASAGGGKVIFTEGIYKTGSFELKSNITLQLDKGAVIQGSDKYADYTNDAFIYGKDLTNLTIQGEGVIDGVDCINSKGEAGYRGAHCILFINCKNISFKDFTIVRSANWAINLRYCTNGKLDNMKIFGGQDGLHTRFCSNFKVTNCDFRTSDDSFAGNDNRDFIITDCKVNTACNGFRIGCLNFTVKRCHIWGPAEYPQKVSNRKNMLSAFVHFSPSDENPQTKSGNWLIEDCTIDHVDHVYMYNNREGLWQTGQPVTTIKFKNVLATNALAAFNIIGDAESILKLEVINSFFSFREGAVYKGNIFEDVKLLSPAFFNATLFDAIKLQNVTFAKKGTEPILNILSGNSVLLDRVNFVTGETVVPYFLQNVNEFQNKRILLNTNNINSSRF